MSSDWAVAGPDLANVRALERFDATEEHPTAAAILPRSGRIVLVSNRFGDGLVLLVNHRLLLTGDEKSQERLCLLPKRLDAIDTLRRVVPEFFRDPGNQ